MKNFFNRALETERQREDDLRRQFQSIIHNVRIIFKKKFQLD